MVPLEPSGINASLPADLVHRAAGLAGASWGFGAEHEALVCLIDGDLFDPRPDADATDRCGDAARRRS